MLCDGFLTSLLVSGSSGVYSLISHVMDFYVYYGCSCFVWDVQRDCTTVQVRSITRTTCVCFNIQSYMSKIYGISSCAFGLSPVSYGRVQRHVFLLVLFVMGFLFVFFVYFTPCSVHCVAIAFVDVSCVPDGFQWLVFPLIHFRFSLLSFYFVAFCAKASSPDLSGSDSTWSGISCIVFFVAFVPQVAILGRTLMHYVSTAENVSHFLACTHGEHVRFPTALYVVSTAQPLPETVVWGMHKYSNACMECGSAQRGIVQHIRSGFESNMKVQTVGKLSSLVHWVFECFN